MSDYSGTEEPIELQGTAADTDDTLFDVRPPSVPAAAVPIYDDSLRAVVGYRHESATGVFKLYDLSGALVGMEEVGLETQLFDPIDAIFFVGGLFRAIGKGVLTGAVRKAPKVAVLTGIRLSARALAVSVVGAMRTTFKGLSVQALKFTTTTSTRMMAKGRYVPLHILHLGIKYGKRAADPQRVKGAFLYTSQLFRNGKSYTLEIVVRESDWTILHFLYK